MERTKCNFVKLGYQAPDSLDFYGTMNAAEKACKKYGYDFAKPKGNGNGNYMLTRLARILVVYTLGNVATANNMAESAIVHYGKKRVTEKLSYKFEQDLEKGKVNIYADPDDLSDYELR